MGSNTKLFYKNYSNDVGCEFDEFRVDTHICKLCTIISIARLYLSVTYQHDRFSIGDRHHSNTNKARLLHRLHFSKESSRGKEPPSDAISGRMHATGFFRGYRLPLFDLRLAQLNSRNDISPCFLCRKCIPCFYAPSPCHKSDKKRVCNIASVLLLVPKLLARV